MAENILKRNERDWAGQLISWIKSFIASGGTLFEDATNDTGLKSYGGRTKFPDILLFTDKVSGVIFHGWELKFPDTAVDDREMLLNALEKARRIGADSFVTWNGAEAIIWKIDKDYTPDSLSIVKHYPKEPGIDTRDDLATPNNYALHEPKLKARAEELLHDLDQLCRLGHIRPAINISEDIIQSVAQAGHIIIPQFAQAIIERKGADKHFRKEFAMWRIYEDTTLRIMSSSSRNKQKVRAEDVLGKFTYYNLVGKLLFYLILSDSIPGELPTIVSDVQPANVKQWIETYFEFAKAIDYQAIFKPYFTDDLPYSSVVECTLYKLISTLIRFDMRLLPTEVMGHILENLVTDSEKQLLGQYFTPPTLAALVAYPVVNNSNSVVLDPTCGTGSLLESLYVTLRHFSNRPHAELLSQVWGNDVSHFPAILSVVNLYKQNVRQRDNFPRVVRDDFFNISPGMYLEFPSPQDYRSKQTVRLPMFDGIASNFPFIQQEDIPNDKLTNLFRTHFEHTQRAFLRGENFKVNERSDYYAYCIYQSLRFLKEGGTLSAITSNAWLGKDYGRQLKQFLLDNFQLRLIVRSGIEHWFKTSQVTTLFFVATRNAGDLPTRFVTIEKRLDDLFPMSDATERIVAVERFYEDIELCDMPGNENWQQSGGLWRRRDGAVSVSIVGNNQLRSSLEIGTNWERFFSLAPLLDSLKDILTTYSPNITKVIRGERTGWNPMFVVSNAASVATGISPQYLSPYVKSPAELDSLEFSGKYVHSAFTCSDNWDKIDRNTQVWIEKFKDAWNKNHSATISEACKFHSPYWYSINPKKAHIVTAINPYDRYFFAFSEVPFAIDQRLAAMQVCKGQDVRLVAALLNSAITFLIIEATGTSRNLGALDLNANYLKTMRLPNPERLTEEDKTRIKDAFAPLTARSVGNIFYELKRRDRILFDQTVCSAYGISEDTRKQIYATLLASVRKRVDKKNG